MRSVQMRKQQRITKKQRKHKEKPKENKEAAAISKSERNEIESETDEEIQCSESEDSGTDSKDPKKKKDAWKKEWKEGGWTMGTNECQPYGPKLNLQGFEVLDELGYLLRFFPMDCIHIVIIPATNQAGSRRKSFKNLSLEELMKFLGLMYAMGIVKMAN